MKIKAQEVNLLFIACKYTEMTLSGKQGCYRGLTPFCKENSPSFFVNPKKKYYKCFSTGMGGVCPVRLVQDIEHCTELEAIEKIESFF